MSDIVERLRRWSIDVTAVPASDIMDEAAGEIERIRSRLRFTENVIRSGNVATLTDAERSALHWFSHYGLPEHHAATLRGLLERLG